MNRKTVLWALVLLNAVLLVALTWKLGFETPANAQPRKASDLVMVPVTIANTPYGGLLFLDTRMGVLGGFVLDPQRGVLIPMPPIPLDRAFQAQPPR